MCKVFLVSERRNKIFLAELLWAAVQLVSQPVTCCCDESLIVKDGSLTMGVHKSITGLHKSLLLVAQFGVFCAFALRYFHTQGYAVSIQSSVSSLLSGCIKECKKVGQCCSSLVRLYRYLG